MITIGPWKRGASGNLKLDIDMKNLEQPNAWEPTAEQFLRWNFNDIDSAKEAAVKSFNFYAASCHPVAIYRANALKIVISKLAA